MILLNSSKFIMPFNFLDADSGWICGNVSPHRFDAREMVVIRNRLVRAKFAKIDHINYELTITIDMNFHVA